LFFRKSPFFAVIKGFFGFSQSPKESHGKLFLKIFFVFYIFLQPTANNVVI